MAVNYGEYLAAFDNDGVISKTDGLWDEACGLAAKELGLAYTPGLGGKIYVGVAPLAWGKSIADQNRIYTNYLLPRAIKIWTTPEWVGRIEMFPKIKEVFTELYDIGVNIGVMTVSAAVRTSAPLEKAGVLHLVRAIVSCIDLGLPDKSVEGLDILAKKVGVSGKKIIYFGDTPQDIKIARMFGCLSVACGYGGYSNRDAIKAENPHAVVDTLEEIEYIPNIVRSLIKTHAGRL